MIRPTMTALSSGRNRVRIIAGKWRSRIVKFPAAAQLRPTPDRVRETLFNWLGQRLDGLACLDLFAGSGALGFEALSRGAARVVMVEREVVAAEALSYVLRPGERFDVVFVDPPYATDLALRTLAALPRRLNPGARVYVETAASLEVAPPWRKLREDRAGAVRYALLELATP